MHVNVGIHTHVVLQIVVVTNNIHVALHTIYVPSLCGKPTCLRPLFGGGFGAVAAF